jgi:hypothetical protein
LRSSNNPPNTKNSFPFCITSPAIRPRPRHAFF